MTNFINIRVIDGGRFKGFKGLKEDLKGEWEMDNCHLGPLVFTHTKFMKSCKIK